MSLSQTFIGPAESPEEAERRREADNEEMKLQAKYNDPQVLQDEKRSLAESLGYKPFSPPEKTPEKHADSLVGSAGETSLMGKAENEKTPVDTQRQEHPMTPKITQLLESGIISKEQSNELTNFFVDGGNVDQIGSLESVKNSPDLQKIKDFLDTEKDKKNTEQNIADFTEKYGEALGCKKDNKGKYEDGTDEDLVKLMGSHFSIIDTGKPEIDQHYALDAAFSGALNGCIKDKIFERNKTFQENSENVRDPEMPIQERYAALKKIYLSVQTSQSLGSDNIPDEDPSIEEAEDKLENAGLYEDFYRALESFRKAEENIPQKIETAQKLEDMRKTAGISPAEASLLVRGDSPLDIASETSQENQKAA